MSRRTLTLPSGSTCVVRKLSRLDFIGSDRIPQAFAVVDEKRASTADTAALNDFAATLGRISMVKACGAITQVDGRRLRIVSKHFAECGPDEVAVEEIPDGDADAIINAVAELTGMTQEAGREAAPFPAGQASAGPV